MKLVTLRTVGSEREPLDILIKPDTTPRQILTQLNLEGYVLARQSKPDQPPLFFEGDQALYPKLEEDDRLFAIAF